MSEHTSPVRPGHPRRVLGSVTRELETAWWPGRRRLALLALLTAALTGALVVALGGPRAHVSSAVLYMAVVVSALFSPAAITVQVIAGQVLVGSLLVGGGGPDPLFLTPALLGVVVTAELLAAVARVDTSVGHHAGVDLGGLGIAALLGGGAFGAVVLLGGLPGPSGVAAVVLASAACGLLALLLVRNAARE